MKKQFIVSIFMLSSCFMQASQQNNHIPAQMRPKIFINIYNDSNATADQETVFGQQSSSQSVPKVNLNASSVDSPDAPLNDDLKDEKTEKFEWTAYNVAEKVAMGGLYTVGLVLAVAMRNNRGMF